jgi:predicted nucleic acid-binding protein
MSYLLDTNVISEPFKLRPEPRVLDWLTATPKEQQFASVLSLGELRRGLETMPLGSHRERIRSWLEHDLAGWYGPRLLPVTLAIADRWGRIAAQARRPLPRFDSLFAATALQHDLRVVTRNVRDFQFPGLEVINPWEIG